MHDFKGIVCQLEDNGDYKNRRVSMFKNPAGNTYLIRFEKDTMPGDEQITNALIKDGKTTTDLFINQEIAYAIWKMYGELSQVPFDDIEQVFPSNFSETKIGEAGLTE